MVDQIILYDGKKDSIDGIVIVANDYHNGPSCCYILFTVIADHCLTLTSYLYHYASILIALPVHNH